MSVLQPHLAMLGGLLRALRQDETLQGSLVQVASFMELRATDYPKKKIPLDFRASLFTSFPMSPSLFQPWLVKDNHHFTFFLYYDLPDLRVFQKQASLFFYREGFPEGYLAFRQEPSLQVELHGDHTLARALWNRLIRVYSLWNQLERPLITHYHFEMDSCSQALSLSTPGGRIWPFAYE